MDLIQRPKQVQRSQKSYLTNEKYQDYAETQFKNVYDYLDYLANNKIREDTDLFEDDSNSSTTITLSETVANFDVIEIYYKGTRESKVIAGSQKIFNADGRYLVINVLFRVGTVSKGCTSLYKINGNTITLETGSQYEFSNGSVISTNNNNSMYITKVIGIGRKEN